MRNIITYSKNAFLLAYVNFVKASFCNVLPLNRNVLPSEGNHMTLSRGFVRILFCLTAFIGLWTTSSNAQLNYNLTKITGQTYTTLSGGGITIVNSNAQFPVAPLMSQNQDDGAILVNLPFTFNYNGNSFTQMTMCTNGWVGAGNTLATIDASNSRAPGNLFTTTIPNNTLAAWFKDGGANFPLGLGSMRHGLIGTDIYAFQWDKNIASGFTDPAVTYISFQVNIYGPASTNPGRIQFIYGGALGAIATGAAVGIEDAIGGINHYINPMSNSGLFNFNGGAINGTTTSAAWPGYGNGYQFNPVSSCSLAPVDQPTVLNLTPISGGQINGTFTAAASNPNGYLVVRYNSSPAPVITPPVNGTSYGVGVALGAGTVVVSGSATSFSATGLTNLTGYDFKVYSFCSNGMLYNSTSPLAGSATSLGNGPPTCPGVFFPGSVTGEANVPPNGLIITWNGAVGVPAISGYDVYLSTNSALVTASDPSVLISPNQAATTFTPVPTLATSTTYYYKIVAKNSFGASSGCSVISFTTATPATVTSTAIGGLWSFPATWVGGFQPNIYDNVVIADGATVVADKIVIANNLTVGQGTSGILQWGGTSFAMIINGNLNIMNGGQFNAFTTGATGQDITLLGDLNNAGLASLDHVGALLRLNGMKTGGGQNINQSGSGVYMGTTGVVGTNKGLIRTLFVNNITTSFPLVPITAPVVNINTPLIINGTPAFAAGTINTGGNLGLDNTAQVYGQAFNQQVFEVVITGMGAGYTSAPAVAISAPTGTGTTATAVANFDLATGTVRSITITNPGSGYRSAPSVTLTGGGFTTAATATAVVVQSVAGGGSINNQINGDYITFTGGFSTINNTHAVGGITTTNGGIGYTSAPTVGFPFPTTSTNLVTNPGAGYTSAPTVTLSGNTFLTGGSNPTFTVTVANGKVVSVYCTGGGTLWNSYPTITITGGGGVGATCAFPTTPGTGCLATATAVISNGQVSDFIITNPGFGYHTTTSITAGLVGGGFTTAATAPTARTGNYGITYGFFAPALTALKRTEGAEIPANRKLNNLVVNNGLQGVDFSGNLEIDGNPSFFAPLSLTSGAARMGGNTLFFSNNTYTGLASTATNYVGSTVRLTSPGGSVTRTFPVKQRGVIVNTGTGSLNTGSDITSLSVTDQAAPTGSTIPAGGVATGTRSYRVQTAGGIYGTNPTVQVNYGPEDGLPGDNPSLFLSQATSNSGPWTVRNSTGGAGALAATGNRTTATVFPGPLVSPAGDDYFAFTTTFATPPALAYSVARTTGNTFSSIITTGSILPFAASASNDDATATAVAIPFSTFLYQGEPVTSFNVCTNGWMKLNTASSAATAATTSANVLGAAASGNFIAPFWDNLTTFPNTADAANTNLNASTRYQIIGSTPGSRQIVVEWNKYSIAGVGGLKLTFQVVLDETDNSIKFNYGPFESFNGNNNYRYTYSSGLVGRFVSSNPFTGQVFAQQYENTTAFDYKYCSNASVGVNGLLSKPECNSSIKFTPGVYAGYTAPAETAPINDDVAGAITIPVSNSIPTDLCGSFFTSRFATSSPQAVCAGTADDDVWFKFVVPVAATSATVRIYAAGGYIPRLQAYSDAGITPLPGTNCVVGTGGVAGTGAGVMMNVTLTGLTASSTYWLRVYHDGGGVQATVQANTSGSVSSFSITNPGSGYNATSTGDVTSARVRFTGGGGTDAVGTANYTSGALASITLNNAGYGYTSNPTVTIEKPNWALNGEFEIVAFTAASNDECVTADTLTNVNNTSCITGQNSRTGVSTGNATASAEAISCVGSNPDDDLWYIFTATSTTSYITVNGNGSFRPSVEVFNGGVTGLCATKTSLNCTSAAAGGTVALTQATIIGNIYFVRVYDFAAGSGGAGTFNICIQAAGPPCVSVPNSPANGGFFCAGPATILSWPAVGTATGYDVFFDAGAGPAVTQVATNQAGTTFTTAVLAAGSYSWRVIPRNANGPATGCGDFTFTVVSNPTAAVAPTTSTICSGNSVSLLASGGTTYNWTPSTGLNAVSGASVTASPIATTSYVVTVTGTGGCTASATSTVTVNLTPTILIAPSSASVCSGGTVAITTTVTNGATSPTFGWSPSTGVSSTSVSNPVITPPVGTTIYTVTVTTTGGCSTTGTVSLTNNGAVADPAPTVGPGVSICGPGTTTLTATGANTLQWFLLSSGGTQIAIGSPYTTPLITSTTTFFVESFNGACAGPRSSIVVTVNPLPVVTVSSNVPFICSGDSALLTASSTLTPTFSWSPSTGLSATNIANPKASPPVGITVYTVTATAATGCSSTATVSVNNLGSGDPAPTTTSFAQCSGQAHLAASGLSTLRWFDAQIGGNLKHIGATWDSVWTATTTYWVESFNGTCPSPRTSVTVTVNPPTSVSISPASPTICSGGSATLTANAPTTSLANVLAAINTNSSTLIASVPTATSFTLDNGLNGTNITDGCSDMYDGGNFLNTNLATSITYSDNTILSNAAALGTGGQYFTRFIGTAGCVAGPATIFYWASDINGLSTMSITGNNGADGSGTQDLNTFTVTANGVTYNCYLKRVFGAGDPSINHLFIIPQPTTAAQTMGASTDDDQHNITGLTGVTRVYYMLYAGAAGAAISVPSATTIAQTFVNIIPPPVTYIWSTGSTASSITVTPPGTTTYTVTVSNGLCTASSSATVTDLGAGDPAPVGVNGSRCGTGSVALTATGNSLLRWYSVPTGGAILGTGSPFNTPSISTTTTFYVESFNGTCPSPRTAVIATVNSVLPVTASATATSICNGSSTTLSATTNTTITFSALLVSGNSTTAQCQAWDAFTNSLVPAPYVSVKMFGDFDGVAAAGRTVSNPATAQAIASALNTRATEVNFPTADQFGNTWRVGLACGSGCGNPIATVELNADNNGLDCACNATNNGWCVRPNLVGSNSGGINTNTCAPIPTQTVNVQFTSAANLPNYSWAPATGLSCTTCANPIASPTVNTTYTVTTTSANGCTSSATVSITVATPPAAPTAGSVTAPCGNGTATLNATGSGGTLKWFTAASGGTQVGTGSPLNIAVISDTTFYVSETTLAAPFCEGPRTAVFVNIIDPDTITASINIPLICNQSPGAVQVTLTAADVSSPQNNVYTYTWTSSAGGGLNTSTGASVTANPTQSATYTVTAFDAGTNCTRIKTVTVGVGTSPTFNTVTAATPSFCQGSSTTITAVASVGGPSSFTFNGGAVTINDATTATPYPSSISVSGLTPTTTVANVKINGLTHTYQGDIDIILVNPSGQFVTLMSDQGNAVGAVGNNYTFQDGAPVFNPAASGTYSCADAAASPDNYPAPGPGAVSGPVTPLLSTFTTAPNGTWNLYVVDDVGGDLGNFTSWSITFTGTSIPVTYSWSPSTGLSSTTGATVTATPPASGTATYTVTAADPAGCTSTASISLTVNVTPSAPACVNDTVCGQGSVTVTATGTGGTLRWLKAIGGPVVTTGPSYTENISTTTNYYVFEESGALTQNVGPVSPAYTNGNFGTTDYQTFDVLSSSGIIINTVEINAWPGGAGIPQVPTGTPVTVQLENNLGQAIGAPVITVTGAPGGTAHNITLNLFVPQGTGWRLRPIQNPILQVLLAGFTYPYTIPGQVSITGIGGPGTTGPQSEYRYFFNWNVTTACFSPLCNAIGVVTPPAPLTITPSGPTTYCGSGTVSLTAGGSPSWVNFNWSPAAGLNATTGATVTATLNTPGVYTYVVTADDGVSGGCVDTQSVVITILPAPTVSVVAAPFDTLCTGVNFQFSSTSNSVSVKQLGASHSLGGIDIIPYNGLNVIRTQILYTKTELNAAGLIGPSNITSLAFEIASKSSTTPYTGFAISMAQVGTTPPVTGYIAGTFSNVFTGNITTTIGWNTYNFTTPFAWDGLSNVVVDVCNGSGAGGVDQVYTTPTSSAQTVVPTFTLCSNTTSTVQVNRPNTRFTGGALLFTWSPSAGLSSSSVANPTWTNQGVGNYTYTLTVKDSATGCTASGSLSFVVSNTPKIPLVAFIGDSVLCVSGTANMRAFGTTGSFQWQVSTDSVNFTNAACTPNNIVLPCDTFSTGVISSTKYYRVFVSCGGDSSYSRILTVVVNNPQVLTTTPGSRCGIGTVTLGATGSSGTTLNWYANPSGGTSIGTGNSFTTPVISSTTTFYVGAAAAGSTTTAVNAPVGTATGSTQAGMPFRGGNGTAMRTQFLYTASELTAAGFSGGNWTEFQWNFTTPIGGACSMGNFTIRVGNTAATGLTGTFLTDPTTVVFGPVAYSPPVLVGAVTFTFGTPFSWDGTSNVYIEICHDNPVPGVGSGQMASNTTGFVSVNFVGAACGTASGGSTQNIRPIINIAGTAITGCFSARVPVTATVTTPPAISVTGNAATCAGDSVTINVTSPNDPNYIYTWEPGTLIGASQVVAPSATTTYTVTAQDTSSGCANTGTVTVTVTQRPTISSITVNPNPVCQGDSAQITVTAIPVIPPSGDYTVGPITFAPVAPTGSPTELASAGTATTPLSFGSLDDGTWESIALPAGFAFNYYGSTPTTFSVSTNGFMAFGALAGVNACCSGQVLPNVGTPNNYIAVAHEDLNFTTAPLGTLDFFTNGVAPFRKFVLRFTGVTRHLATGNVTAMIVLNETFNTIEMHLTSVTTTGGDFTTQAIENSTGSLFTVVPGRNSSVWNATNEGWQFSPPVSSSLSYSWTPPTGLSSTSVSNPKVSPGSTTSYTVTVLETGTGCTKSGSVVVNVTPKPKPYLVGQLNQNILGDTIVCSNDPGFYIQVKDSGAYAGGYPAGTTFEFVGLTAPSNTDDSTFVSSSIIETVIVTLPPSLGGCADTTGKAPSGPANIDFGTQQAQQVVLTTDSVGCFGESTGNAIATIAFGGTPNFRWQWYDASFTLLRDTTDNLLADTLFGVPAGWYYFTSTDHQGVVDPPYCQVIDSIFVGEPASPLNVDEVLANHVDVQCYGYGTGAIDLIVTGGVPGYTYDWSNGSTDEDQSGLVAGVYTVTVTDQHGCTYEFATEIVQNPQVTIGTAQSNVSCHNGFDGTATVYVNGGVPGYTYLWSDGQTTETAFDLAAGIYTVIITDNSGSTLVPPGPSCDTIMTFLISEPPQLDATGTVIDLNCFGASNGVATANPFGGTPPYSYDWNTIPTQTTQTATGLQAGTVVVTITDSVGCTKDLVLQINQPDSLYFDKTIDDVTCNGGNDGSITISVNGGTPGYSYLWSNGGTTETISGLTAGTYVVTVTDANGCQVIGSMLVNEPSAINLVMSQTNVSCYGLSNGSALATVSGGTPSYSYSWNTNPAQSTNSATGLTAGTYTLVITDAVGCIVSQDVVITQPDSIALNENVTQPLCNGGLGSVELFVTGGTLPYNIIWSNGNTTQTNGGLVAGTYTVTVTDANGCVSTQIFVITAPDAIVVTPTITNVSCFGSVNGSIVLSVTGGVGPYTYQWSSGSTDNFITGLAAGNYTVTVTDANSCSVTVIVPVTQPAELTCICNSNVTNVSCFGGSNGSITALPVGGTAPYSYSWKRIAPTVSGVLATTQTISGLTAGTYEVTITDANGCVKVGTATVTQPSQLVATATVINNSCSGNANGQITLTVSGGVPPYTYAWNTVPPQTTAIATGLTAGSYTAVVTDANGCTKVVTATVTQPAGITLTTSKNNVSCNGGANGTASVTATGGVTPYSYLWSNGKTTKNITGLAAGTYTVVVTDGNGCSKTASVVITQPTKITALYVVTNPNCFGATNGAIDITVTGGTPPYTYTWSTGATTQDLNGIVSGAYSVFITDSKGCVILANIILTQPNAIALSTTIKDVTCFGGNNGKVTVLATGGTSPYTYVWSNGQTNAAATNLTAGTYTVTVTDTKGCSLSISATVGQSPQLVCSANVGCMNNVSCFGGSNGKLCVSVTGGKAPYTYSWNTSPVATTAAVNNVPAGTYTVVVTDKNGCTTSCTFTITQPAALVVAPLASTNVSCKNGSNGTASITTVTGGTPPYSYSWNTVVTATTTSVSGLTAGTYKVTVTDANGCTATATVKITQPTQLVLNTTKTNLACNGAGTGSITATATGGTPAYIYTLNPGAITNGTGLFTGLGAGTYDVTVTDANGCSVTKTGIVITEPSALTMDPTSGTDVNCFGGNNGTATAGAVAGGTPPYVYIWNTIPPQGTATATGLTAGTYIVMVTDAKGCTVSGTVIVNQPAAPLAIAIINQTNITCSGGTTGDATADATGGTAPYTYEWSDGQTTAQATGLVAGTYVVTATDANGCQALTSVTISQANAFSVAATSTNVSCNGGADGTITATVSGGNPPILYTLNPGAITNGTGSFTGLTVGTYTVTAADAGGCTATTVVTITQPSILIANAFSTNVSCNGGSNGTATVFATGGTAPYSYSWTGGSTLQNPSGLLAGTYTVTVTDANGCTLERTVTITEPAAMAIAQSQVNVLCNGGATGSATATVSGGTAPYFYFWNNGQMTQTAAGLTAGTYTVTVTDYKGCSVTSVYTITEGSAIVANPAQGTITCFGGTTTISVAPAGGIAPYSYSWSQDALNASNSAIVGAGTYYVVITDSTGCDVTQSFTVTEPSAILCGATSTNLSCNDINNGTASVSASGGTAPYTYLWSNSSTDASISGLAPGTYVVLITDSNGCTTSCSVTITEPAELSLSLSTSNASCGTNNGSAMAIVSGGTAPYSYLWDDGETTASINGLAAGTYTVTVTDANGCGPQTASVTIGDTPPVSCSIAGTDPTCAGYNNGFATVTVTGGGGSNTYSWNTAPIQTTATATGLAAGTYEVTVTDITGCSSTCSVDITEPSPLVLTASQNSSACSGSASGVATVTAFGGLPPYSYLWTNGQTTATATGLSAGAAYVTVTDAAGCSEILCVIMQQPVAISCNTSTTPAACGQAIGSATVNVFGGQGPYSYNWNTIPQQSNAIATLLSAGTYTVVVTDANGCSTQCTATVVQPGGVSYILTVVNPNCNGGTGSVTVSLLNGGTAPYTFNWSNGSSSASSGAVLAGTYTVTVTDSSGCSNIQSATVIEPSALVVTTTHTNVNCFGNVNGGACVNATGGTQPYGYAWSTGANSQCISNLAAGTYTVTATDSKGCTSSAAVVITQPAILDTLSTSTTVASCGLSNGTATVIPTGGTGPYTYSWNTIPVQTGATATGLAAGNNFVTITDANGCSITICVKVPSSAGIGLSLVSPVYAGGYNIRCNGGTDGSINLTVSGSGPFTYNWSTGATTEDIFGLTAGTYTVTVTNGGCTSVGIITLTEAPAWTITTTHVNVTCFGGNNGSATVTAIGGTAPYNYSWNTIPVQTTQTATGLTAGAYTVTVSDANGCTQTALVVITQPSSGLNITATSVNPSCNGSSNGSINITVTGGTPPYSYLWTGGSTTEDQSGIAAGSHTVTVTDANGCTIALCVVLVQPTQIALTTSKTDVSCAGGNSGSASATAAGGTPPYTYQWSNGATTSAITGLFAGNYTVTVTDANGCIRNATVTINSAAAMVLSTSSTNVTVYGGNNGTASVSVVSGGTPAYAYSWNTIPAKTTAAITGLAAGTYQVTVTDSKGCVKTASVVITQPNYVCSSGTPFRTETPSRWGASSGTANTYLTANFNAAFPAGLVVGGGCGGGKTLTLTSANAVRAYEINQAVSGAGTVLSANLVNPTSVTFPSALGANTVALKLNVVFDAYDPNFAPIPTVQLGNLIYNAAPFSGLTVNQILLEANKKLGGCSSAFTVSQLNTAIQNIDSAYKAGVTGPTASFLVCPSAHFASAPNAVETNTGISAYPNPSTGVMNLSFTADQDGKVIVNLLDVTGRLVWNVEENVFSGENVRTYNFNELRKGIYFMQVTKDGRTDIVRIVLQ
ncbi:MAG: T9SS type A sorting domain-containing protein [Bacteroidia bacterium]